MVKIINITLKKEQYNITFDNGEELLVSAETIAEFFLYNGKELSLKDLAKIKEYEAQTKHFSYASNLLARRPYTSHEIREKLRKRRVNEEVIDLIVDKLKRLNLINDLRYALDKIQYLINVKKCSTRAIEQDLLRRGIHPYVIKDALAQSPRDERCELEILIPKLLKSYRNESLRRAYQKLKTKLYSLGFESDNIDEVLAKFNVEDYIDETENIKKALVKLEKKAKGDTKVLYNKLVIAGYPASLIRKLLEDYSYEN